MDKKEFFHRCSHSPERDKRIISDFEKAYKEWKDSLKEKGPQHHERKQERLSALRRLEDAFMRLDGYFKDRDS